MDLFVFIATAFFAFFFIVWKTSNIPNTIIKTAMFAMTVYGIILSAQILGFVVKV